MTTLFRASVTSRGKKSSFAGFSETDSWKNRPISQKFWGLKLCQKAVSKKRPISWEFSSQISLEIDQFCADLTSMFNVFNRDNHLLF